MPSKKLIGARSEFLAVLAQATCAIRCADSHGLQILRLRAFADELSQAHRNID